MTELFKGLSKKKKKKSKDAEVADAEEGAVVDGEFDPSTMKKKKKKSTKKAVDGGDFEAKLAEAGLADEGPAEEKPSAEDLATDLENGTGIWSHNSTQTIPYRSERAGRHRPRSQRLDR